MKLRRISVIVGLLVCTMLYAHPFIRQVINLPTHSENTKISYLKPSGLLTKFISVDLVPETDLVLSQTLKQDFQVSYKLFGIFPFKNTRIEVLPSIKLLPGGQSIGVSLQTQGVMIVGQASVNKNGSKTFPAKEAGIETGDSILKINGKEVHTDQDVAHLVNEAGKNQQTITLHIKHQNQIIEKSVQAVYCDESKRYRIGLFVRNEATGVGTLTFIDPITKKYGALGHVINDLDTNQRIEVSQGLITNSTIYGIEKSTRGHPGEKQGTFSNNSKLTGNIEKNTPVGIFGQINGEVSSLFKEPIEVGWASEIKEGPAKIYTVLHGEQIQDFDVKIERIIPNRTDSKNMIISIVDPKLIEITGGIIQGMSGSPIIQNGKIIGAVTHVFINDSQRGYGVFIQNMLKESGILEKKEAKVSSYKNGAGFFLLF
ncbi:MAG: SpoIVB peptidase [Desulfitobacteriaceae bacterium]|nr:SpoIVB peptidase [Desulfitobacteriaceae bacterium]MDD4346129.1 SpoIVB peptidase [Desulfitobacteriaceae bacterium]MDD4401089.1 SpoIVB peptidase [Desulfitobacteriaceae bacterium]